MCMWWADSSTSNFTGRPPALSRRYQSCPLSLDLSDEVLMTGDKALDKAVAALDENGWNTEGKVYDATNCRHMLTYFALLDEIMEVFIGNSSQWSLERVMYV